MNLGQTLMKLLRRWYVLLPGLMLAVVATLGMWATVPPQYERTSTQVLLPGRGSLPPESENPYMFIGSLSLAADVVVRATGSENMVKEVEEQHPAVTFQVSRDSTTAGPVIRTTVRAPNDDEAGVVLEQLTERTAIVLVELQDTEGIPQADRITVVTVTIDEQGIASNRTRLILTGGTGAAVAGFFVFLAALVEGIANWRRSKLPACAARGHADSSSSAPRGESQANATEDPGSSSPSERAVEEQSSGDSSAEGATDERESPTNVATDVASPSHEHKCDQHEKAQARFSLVDSQRTQ